MATYDDDEFATGESGAASTEPKQCSSLKKGGFVVMKGRPCKIVDMSTSKTGKHGSAKAHLVGIDIFTGKKYEEISSTAATLPVPVITRKEYQLMGINDGFLTLMGDDCAVFEDIKLPDSDIGKELLEKWTTKGESETIMVSVVSAMDEEHALGYRSCTDK